MKGVVDYLLGEIYRPFSSFGCFMPLGLWCFE